ncbi:MAG: class I SAM-dependent methyltransferase [Ruminococcus sp.]|nr:class I SAM-dependent methyltransferase [Ruminococcus sp.]
MKEKTDFRFDKKAEKYDESYEGRLSEKFYELVTHNVSLHEGMAVLEMGCGTGTILHRLSQKCSIDGYGIDIEDKMLEQARKKCPEMQILNSPCDATPFENESFDAIVACMAYHHFPDKDSFSKECARLLKKGGKLYIADPKLPLPVRKVLNTALEIHKINGKVYTADEISANFSPYGFKKQADSSDAYAQIICLEKL